MLPAHTEKQLRIMETAETLFAEKGFNGTSVRDIAERAGINLAMVSYYFGSKDKLLEALFESRGETTKLTLEEIEKKKGLSGMDKMNLLVDHYIHKIMSQQCFHRVLVREQVLNNSEAITKMILAMKKRNLEIISRIIQEGQKKGEFKKNVDIPLMMATMVGTASNLITSRYYYRELNNLQMMSEEELDKHIQKKLSQHLKLLFKTILTHEA
jgi:AcrR family transcriptional regulator